MGIQQMGLSRGVNFIVDAQNISAESSGVNPQSASVTISGATGQVTTLNSGPDFDLVTAGAPVDLQIFITTVSGALTSGTVGSWISLGQLWTLDRSALGASTYTATYAVRVTATGEVLATGVSFILMAEVL